jgi:rubrerythrin
MALEALKAYADAQQPKKQTQQPPEPVNKVLTAHMDREKQSWELYKKMADNIRLSELLRCKINKDVKAGAEIYNLLVDALKCISLMTGDTVFYEQNIKALEQRER